MIPLVLLLLATLPTPAAPPAPAPARVQAAAEEFRLTLSRSTIRSGPAVVELVNFGEDEHDLRLRRLGGTRTYGIRAVPPGGLGSLDARLAPGRFTLWCSIADHARRGMTARLTVRARRPA